MNEIVVSPCIKGFSLVEMIIVVAIIAVMSSSATIGWNHFNDEMAAGQTGKVIEDVIEHAALGLLTDIEEVILHFRPDYLVLEETHENSNLVLELDNSHCQPEEEGLVIKSSGVLKKEAENVFSGSSFVGENIHATNSYPEYVCLDFKDSLDNEWVYTLTDGRQTSSVRFFHFNIKRDTPSGHTAITDWKVGANTIQQYNGELKLVLKNEWSKKYYNNNARITGTVTLFLKNKNNSSIGTQVKLR